MCFKSVTFRSAKEIRAITVLGLVPRTRLNRTFDENISTDGELITTRSQRRRIMKEGGLEYRPKREKPIGSRLFFDMGRK